VDVGCAIGPTQASPRRHDAYARDLDLDLDLALALAHGARRCARLGGMVNFRPTLALPFHLPERDSDHLIQIPAPLSLSQVLRIGSSARFAAQGFAAG